MLEISPDHILKLSDENLRELVRRLCQAELLEQRKPISSIIAGGDQDEADGGIDVRVALAESYSGDFIPREKTGFQVKKPNMGPAEISKEMRPNGALRSSIRELLADGGAYVIVSAKGSVADSGLKKRVAAMHSAAGVNGEDGCILRFYGRDQLATWANKYPGVVLWLRDRVGEPLVGWRPFGAWAAGEKIVTPFISDHSSRILDMREGRSASLTCAQGIAAIRKVLSVPQGVVRLVGLSGLGKTRLVQALFESGVGDSEPIDQCLAIYSDEGNSPSPPPQELICRIGASGRRAVLIVDNCKPYTHQVLVQMVQQSAPNISLVTVEYDIAEDMPEFTAVFRLEPGSDDMVIAILERHAPQLGELDRRRIAEFAGGNARIALALARNSGDGSNLSRLADANLFRRLFVQRNSDSDALQRAAEACSLVYSFDGETIHGSDAELPLISEIAGLQTSELYRYVQELRQRDLAQSRSHWRAILPHAIANRLAKKAIEDVPLDKIMELLGSNRRLFKSFTRRLSYLHDSPKAVQIAETWLTEDSWMGNVSKVSNWDLSIFRNIAPLSPASALSTIERSIAADTTLCGPGNTWRAELVSVVWALAYEPSHFDRAAMALAQFLAAEPEDHKQNSARNYFVELFRLYLSGTEAPISQRLALIGRMFDNSDVKIRRCGIVALEGALEAWHFNSFHDFAFGSRSRSFGWEPQTDEDIRAWYRATLAFINRLRSQMSPVLPEVYELLANSFRGLWLFSGAHKDLLQTCRAIASDQAWTDGWIATKMTLSFDAEKMDAGLLDSLRQLEAELRPVDFASEVRVYVLSKGSGALDIADSEAAQDDDSASAYERAETKAESLGVAAHANWVVCEGLLGELLVGQSGRHWSFGKGLALGAAKPEVLWLQLTKALESIPEVERNLSLHKGFLEGIRAIDPKLRRSLLDTAVSDPVLGHHFPYLQSSAPIDDADGIRVLRSLDLGLARAGMYSYMQYGRIADNFSDDLFAQIVLRIADLEDGFSVALKIYHMHISSLGSRGIELSSEMRLLGCRLLSHFAPNTRHEAFTHHVNEVAKCCLEGHVGREAALVVCRELAKAGSGGMFNYGELVQTLFRHQPWTALHVFFGGKKRCYIPILYRYKDRGIRPLQVVPTNILLAWAKKKPKTYFPRLAREVSLIEQTPAPTSPCWSSTALALMEKCPDLEAVLGAFEENMQPRVWSRPLAEVLGPYRVLLDQLNTHHSPVVVQWAAAAIKRIESRIQKDQLTMRQRDESFE